MYSRNKAFRAADLHVANNVEGMLSGLEGRTLYDLAARARIGIIEIGCYEGRSTAFLGLGSKSGNRVPLYTVDHFNGSEEHRLRSGGLINTLPNFNRNMVNVGLLGEGGGNGDILRVIPKDSKEAIEDATCPNHIDLLFIDASHDYNSVWEDVQRWGPLLVEGGIIALHDTFWARFDGPRRVASELLSADQYSGPELKHSLLYMKKGAPENPLAKIRNNAFRVLLNVVGPRAAYIGKLDGLRRNLMA